MKFIRRLAPFAGAVLFGISLWVLHREAALARPEHLRLALRGIGPAALSAAALSAAASYFVLALSEITAARFAGSGLCSGRVAPVSFVSNAIGFNVGMPIVSGGSVRYRLYSSSGLGHLQIAGIVAMCGVATAMGHWTFAGGVLFADSASLLARLDLGRFAWLPRLGGASMLAIIGVVFATSALIKRGGSFGVLGRFFPAMDPSAVPGPWTLARRLALGLCDVIFASLVIFFLLPHNRVALPVLCGAFALSHIAGGLCQIPAGLGVFEATMLWFLTPGCCSREELLGAILIYRAVYFLLPLGAACCWRSSSRRLSRAGSAIFANSCPGRCRCVYFWPAHRWCSPAHTRPVGLPPVWMRPFCPGGRRFRA